MLEVKFYDSVDDSLLKFAVIVSQSNGKWVLNKIAARWPAKAVAQLSFSQ